MDGTDAPQTHAGGTHGEPWVWLAVRTMSALAVGAGAGLFASHAVSNAAVGSDLLPLVAGVMASCIVGGILLVAVIAPLVRSRAQLTVAYQAALADSLRDQLTALGNHRAFQEELDRQVEASQRYEVPLSLAIVDLDEFKSINDTGGHASGDRALSYFGRLLATTVRRSDRCFRIGGDEFAIILPHTDAEGARVVLRRLLATALAPPLRSDDLTTISFSAGISSMPEPATSRAQLYSQADSALYGAKHAGRTEVIVFDPGEATPETSPEASAAVAEVIARGQLRPVYQPIIAVDGGLVLGYEGLIRPMPPAPFDNPLALFAAAAASGHLVGLDLTCVETLVKGARTLPAAQFLSVNLSPRTVEAPEFNAASLLSILARHGFPADRLVLELTEHEPITDIDRVRDKLDACRRAGIRLAADDLGAGNAGLRLLSELRFDVLKVDLTLIQRSAQGGPSSEVVQSVVGLAARTGALVIGEGVEYPEQLQLLASLGVGAGQGYLLGRPGPLPGTAQPQPREPLLGSPASARPREPEPVAISAPMAAWRQSIGLPN
jgi:diguanylate cyclase (GGDEF)-like protein